MATTKRIRRSITIGLKIKMAQDAMVRQKTRLGKAIAKLEALMAKQEELRKRELIGAVAASEHSYYEILQFIKE